MIPLTTRRILTQDTPLITMSARASTLGGTVRPTFGALKPISDLISQAAYFFNPCYLTYFLLPMISRRLKLKWDERCIAPNLFTGDQTNWLQIILDCIARQAPAHLFADSG